MTASRLLPLALVLAPLACGGESPSSGVTAFMRVTGTGAQFVPGELTIDERAMEPTVETVTSGNAQVFPGAQGRSAGGTVSSTSSAVLIGLSGDTGHWLVPVGIRDASPPYNFSFSTSLSFSPALPTGKRTLVFRAIDATGSAGPAQTLPVEVDQPFPTGNLVIQLVWDTEADLDLHLRLPNPNAQPDDLVKTYDVWARAPRGLPPKPATDTTPYTQAELNAGGGFVSDSNAQCVIDGQRQEFIVFPGAVPGGPYEVRVDTFSLCGEPTAHWWVGMFDATSDTPDKPIVEARGQSTERDTIASHAADSGTLAFTY